ncbi:MFS general substrate transporter [Setomelanomma holmii]|uniref:MFS general substrate transporter n=1 Tax=Setomelanomma holmii TaxID=210430 RepID=A0A9P4LPR4_9PLEO|nr:MFS general substrate transporter [Setomelanomma holmii]
MSKPDLQAETPPKDDGNGYPPFKKVLPAMVAIWLAFFVVALQFNSFGDIAWYEAAFLLPFCVLQLSFVRIYQYYSPKWVIIANIAIFEIGSIVCATAPSSKALIVGRAITGIGGAGVPPGAFLLINFLVPVQSRPKYIGSLGSVFGVTSILGPILGGYLTAVTWRWCFWINLPVGGVSMILLVLLVPTCTPPLKRAATWMGKLSQLDPLGFILIAPSLISLLLAIQLGGKEYSWNSGVVVALFVIFGVLRVAFVASQIWRGEKGTLPPHIISQRSILAGTIASLVIDSVLVLFAFFLPVWFQVGQGKSPQSSGLSLIPLLLSVVFAVIASGIFASTVGYYVPSLILGAALIMVGAGLISTWSVDVGSGKWIGFQIITGAGLGLTLQGPNIAAQTVLSKEDVSIGLSVLGLFNFLGSTIFVTLKPILPDVDLGSLVDGSASSIRSSASSEQLPAVLNVYNDSIKSV